jgi:MFS family permease
MSNRSSFPKVFWVANTIEVLERFAYYGIYMSFGIYLQQLGYSKGDLGWIQSIFLFVSYFVPVISGTFADRYGFKKILLISYLAYLPSILLLMYTDTFSGIALTMLTIGFAAGIFKPLVSGTVRAVTDSSNKTLGFGIFYMMVNFGASFGPIVLGKLRAISWNHAFLAAAITIGLMFLVTLFFYKEPERELQNTTLKEKFSDLGVALSDKKFTAFLILLGVFFWLPFWAFFNVLPVYIDGQLDTAALYEGIKGIFGGGFASVLSHQDDDGVWRILGETISHTGYIIILFQLLVSKVSEKYSAIPTFLVGLVLASVGCIMLGTALYTAAGLVFLGVFLFAVGEMVSSPRIQEYITWIAPKEKAGLYMGANFMAVGLGGFLSGITYTRLYGYFEEIQHPDYIWYTLAVHLVVAAIVIYLFFKTVGVFKELEE